MESGAKRTHEHTEERRAEERGSYRRLTRVQLIDISNRLGGWRSHLVVLRPLVNSAGAHFERLVWPFSCGRGRRWRSGFAGVPTP